MHDIFNPSLLDLEQIKLCQKFAKESSNNYHLRGQVNESRICAQITAGKIGEFGAYDRLSVYLPIDKPDVEIYEKGSKSWAPDLRLLEDLGIGAGIHVKTVQLTHAIDLADLNDRDIESTFSWTFQLSDKSGFGRDAVLDAPDGEIVVFVFYDNMKIQTRIEAILPIGQIRKLFKPPLNEELRDYKQCVYLSDIKNAGLYQLIPVSLASFFDKSVKSLI